MIVERYSHVMHLIVVGVGHRRRGRGALDVLRAGFPAGTLTGAPKIRAMEIIDELEPARRGIYGGAVGYVSFTGQPGHGDRHPHARDRGRRASTCRRAPGIVAD